MNNENNNNTLNSLNALFNTNSGNESEKPRPCCVCKETKSARDLCLMKNDESDCLKLIHEHNQCLKSYGFSIVNE